MLFNFLDTEIIIFATIFLIFTALIRFALAKKIMVESKGTASIIAICISLLASYGLMKTGISLKLANSINLSSGFLINVLPWLIIIILIAISIRWSIGATILSIGVISLVAGISNLLYTTTFLIILGIILIIGGILLIRWKNKRKRYKGMHLKDREIYKRERKGNR